MSSYAYCYNMDLKDDKLSHVILRCSEMIAEIDRPFYVIAKSNTCPVPLSNNLTYVNNYDKRVERSVFCHRHDLGIIFSNSIKYPEPADGLIQRGTKRIAIYVENDKEYIKYIHSGFVKTLSSFTVVNYITDNKKIKIFNGGGYISVVDPDFIMNRSVIDRNLQISGYYSNRYAEYYSALIRMLKKINPDFELKLIGYHINNLKKRDLIELYNESMFWIETNNEIQFRIKDAILCGCLVIAPKGGKYDRITYRFNDDPIRMAKIIADMSYDVNKRGEMVHSRIDNLYPINYTDKCKKLYDLLKK